MELSAIHFNIRSLNRNHHALCQFLEMLVLQFDVIILSEIWAINIDFYCNILPWYTFHYDLPKDSHVGGVGIYISDTFTQCELNEYKISNSNVSRVENIWLEVTRNSNKYIIGGIYRHPNQNVQDFTVKMKEVLGKISAQALPCVLAGDFNMDLTKCIHNNQVAEYVDNLLTNNFIPVTVMPTRIHILLPLLITFITWKDLGIRKMCM